VRFETSVGGGPVGEHFELLRIANVLARIDGIEDPLTMPAECSA